jgi:hypothetical protein
MTTYYGRSEYGRVWHDMIGDTGFTLCGTVLTSPTLQNYEPPKGEARCKLCADARAFRLRMAKEARP